MRPLFFLRPFLSIALLSLWTAPLVPGQTPPSATQVSATHNTDVSSFIGTGSGYDAWTGSTRRTVTDFSVPGAVSSHGLVAKRTYSSSSGWNWNYSWFIQGRPAVTSVYAPKVYLPGGGIATFQTGTKERLFSTGNSISEFGTYDLYLEDGSIVHFNRFSEYDEMNLRWIDTNTPEYVLDPYGRKTLLEYENFSGGHPAYDIRLKRWPDPRKVDMT